MTPDIALVASMHMPVACSPCLALPARLVRNRSKQADHKPSVEHPQPYWGSHKRLDGMECRRRLRSCLRACCCPIDRLLSNHQVGAGPVAPASSFVTGTLDLTSHLSGSSLARLNACLPRCLSHTMTSLTGATLVMRQARGRHVVACTRLVACAPWVLGHCLLPLSSG